MLLNYIKGKKNAIIVWLIFILVIFFAGPDERKDLSLLFGPHKMVYPIKWNVDEQKNKRLVSYSYPVGEKIYENEHDVYALYLWFNDLYPTSKQYRIIYKIDDPENSQLLGNVYMNIASSIFFALIAGVAVFITDFLKYVRRYKEEGSAPQVVQNDEDFIKRK